MAKSLGNGVFKAGPLFPSYAKPFVVQDRNLITARWPGDAQAWAEQIRDALLNSGEIAA